MFSVKITLLIAFMCDTALNVEMTSTLTTVAADL